MNERSRKLHQRAQAVIPGGVNSPVRSFKDVGGTPLFFERGVGAFLFDVDGNRYADFCLSFGPHLLGHSPKPVLEALYRQIGLATSFGACHEKEVELAELILRAYPRLSKVRLVNSGTEAVMTAIRLARGATNRSRIIKFNGCYHGHSDGLLVKAGSGVASLSESSSKGIPQSIVSETLSVDFRNFSALEKTFEKYPAEIAAVILEPVPANHGLWVPPKEMIDRIVSLARRKGALIIFDEVINGFRVGLSGATGYYGLDPDLVTLGKIIGGGLPLAAVAGKAQVMDFLAPQGSVYQAGTLAGNPLATAAGCAVLNAVFADPPYEILAKRCESFARALEEKLTKYGPVKVHAFSSMFWIEFGEPRSHFPYVISPEAQKTYSRFFTDALKSGVYFAPSPYEVGFLSTAHEDSVLESVLEKL